MCITISKFLYFCITSYFTIYLGISDSPKSRKSSSVILSKLKKIYIGTMDEKTGAVGSVLNLFKDYTFNHKVEVETGIMKEECEKILKEFFKKLRELKKN